MAHQGVPLVLDANVSRICHAGCGVYAQYHDQTGAANEAYGEYVLQVSGHQTCTDGLGLDHTAVGNDRHGILLNHVMETDEPDLYAAGDVIGRFMFAHWAAAQSQFLRSLA